MYNISLIGKKYEDTILFTDETIMGESNNCKIVNSIGGIYNFKEIEYEKHNLSCITVGRKKAYVIVDRKTSKRTSFVNTVSESNISSSIIDKINQSDWLHVCYIDDIEDYKKLLDIKVSLSLDFCTLKNRNEFARLIDKSVFIFDSRERKHLYENIKTKTPIILHDEYGVEIIKNNDIIFSIKNTPVSGLNVNGAGDIFSAIFLKNYRTYGIMKSAKLAMRKTTNILINRRKNEQKI